MTEKHEGRYCPACKQNVMAVGSTPNHALHGVLSLLTCGWWLLGWLFIVIIHRDLFRCTRCGSPI
jgi:hypothetical protein